MKQYEAYKDSGIQWLGEIPSHWTALKLKYICAITDGTHFSPATKSEGRIYVTVSNVYDDEIHLENASRISEEDFQNLVRQGCQPKVGDVLLAKDGTVGRSAIVVDNDFVALSSLGILSPGEQISSSFLKYSLDSLFLQEQMNAAMAGSALRRITISKICEFIGIIPPLAEQEVIAAYLDLKVGQIDAILSEKEAMVEQLQQYRKSLISENVTRGLNPNVPMKDSGIDWIGQIPQHWSMVKLKYISSLQSGSNLTSEQIRDTGEYPVFGGNGLRGYYHDFNTEGDRVLIGRQGALCGNINYASGKFWATEHAVVCHPIKQYNVIWLGSLLEIMNLNQYSIASAQPGLSVDRIKQLEIPLPPFEEQEKIGSLIEKKDSELKQTISELQSQIEDLKAYKSSVITEAVTGKVDLRDWKPSEVTA